MIPVIIFVLKPLLIYAKYFENSAPKLFLNYGMNEYVLKLIKNIFVSRDGTATYAQFYQPAGIATGFDNIVYVCDTKLAVKMIPTMSHTSDFLNAAGKLSKAFSVHEKRAQYSVKNLTEAAALTRECITVLESYVDSIKEKNENLPKVLNGSEGSISNKTYDSSSY